MKVLFYGRLAEMIGPELELDAIPGSSVSELRKRLVADHPNAGEVLRNRRSRACVSGALVWEDYVPEVADTVEFLSPVSGG